LIGMWCICSLNDGLASIDQFFIAGRSNLTGKLSYERRIIYAGLASIGILMTPTSVSVVNRTIAAIRPFSNTGQA
ncbi:MAG: hypothetical protein AAGL92_15615, partial [Pseudomonadota bacterium]